MIFFDLYYNLCLQKLIKLIDKLKKQLIYLNILFLLKK
jgi:hypothetical protein